MYHVVNELPLESIRTMDLELNHVPGGGTVPYRINIEASCTFNKHEDGGAAW